MMRLDLGLSLSGVRSASTPFNPATLSGVTGYWQAYAGDPWTSTAAGSRTWTAGAAPPTGANFGTNPSADFNGAGHFLIAGSSLKLDSFVSRTAWFVQVIAEIDTLGANAAQPYNEVPLFQDNGGNLYIATSVGGIRAGHYDDVAYRATTKIAVSTGTKYCVQAWYDGTNVNCRVNGGTTQSAAAASLTSAYNLIVPRLGTNTGGFVFLDGRIAQVILANTALTSQNRTDLYAHAQASFEVP